MVKRYFEMISNGVQLIIRKEQKFLSKRYRIYDFSFKRVSQLGAIIVNELKIEICRIVPHKNISLTELEKIGHHLFVFRSIFKHCVGNSRFFWGLINVEKLSQISPSTILNAPISIIESILPDAGEELSPVVSKSNTMNVLPLRHSGIETSWNISVCDISEKSSGFTLE